MRVFFAVLALIAAVAGSSLTLVNNCNYKISVCGQWAAHVFDMPAHSRRGEILWIFCKKSEGLQESVRVETLRTTSVVLFRQNVSDSPSVLKIDQHQNLHHSTKSWYLAHRRDDIWWQILIVMMIFRLSSWHDTVNFNGWRNQDCYDLSEVAIKFRGAPVSIKGQNGGPTVRCSRTPCPDAYNFHNDDKKNHCVRTGGNYVVTWC